MKSEFSVIVIKKISARLTHSNTDTHTIDWPFLRNKAHRVCCSRPDITSLTQFPGCHAAELGHSKVSSHSDFADGIVFRHNFHCIWSRRGWKSLHSRRQAVLYSTTLIGSRKSVAGLLARCPLRHAPLLHPSHPCLQGGKAWISPFPLSLAL